LKCIEQTLLGVRLNIILFMQYSIIVNRLCKLLHRICCDTKQCFCQNASYNVIR